ncbi:hypothetical protein FRX31_022912, partial [Thalictrum thalictroides]
MVQGFLAQKKNTHKAMQFLSVMIKRGFSPTAETTSMVVDLLAEDGPIPDDMEMLHKFLPK